MARGLHKGARGFANKGRPAGRSIRERTGAEVRPGSGGTALVATHDADRILGLTPFGRADSDMVIALCRAGALGVLDLGRDPAVALSRLGFASVTRLAAAFFALS